jgi:thiol:disulfide interchange protein DsbD
MVGLYEFQFLPSLIAKLDTISSRCRGMSGTFLMGATAGLVVSPCVGPVAGTLLLEITGQAAGASALGEAVTASVILRGIVLMTSFGTGLGIPFLVVGWLSNRLPQSGTWLTKVKFGLGLSILYFAYNYYLKGMETARVPENVAHAILIGIIAIGIAAFIGAFHPIGANPRPSMLLRRALGVILLIVGIYFLYNGLGQSGILLTLSASQDRPPAIETLATRTLVSNSTPQPAVEIHGNLHWLVDNLSYRCLQSIHPKELWCGKGRTMRQCTRWSCNLNR